MACQEIEGGGEDNLVGVSYPHPVLCSLLLKNKLTYYLDWQFLNQTVFLFV